MTIRDALGNEIAEGDLLYFRGQIPPIGKVINIFAGGISLGKEAKTPARLRLIFDVTITIAPGQGNLAVLQDVFRVINPESEKVITKALEEKTSF